MSSFSEIIEPVIGVHDATALRTVLEQLGSEVKTDLEQLDRPRRAALVDRLVRNLRGMSVHGVPKLERELLRATGAEPRGTFRWSLDSATGLVEVRSGLKYLATWLGFEWADISRLQAVLGGLSRWVHSTGTGTLTAEVESSRICFEFQLEVPGLDAKTIESSALVTGVRHMVTDYATSHQGDTVFIKFTLTQR